VLATESLSMVLTVAYSLKKLELMASASLCIYLLGSVREDKTQWDLLSQFVPDTMETITLVYIGPDLEPPGKGDILAPSALSKGSENNESKCLGIKQVYVAGTYHSALQDGALRDSKAPPADVMFALNSGMHFYKSWRPTVTAVFDPEQASSSSAAALLREARRGATQSQFSFGFGGGDSNAGQEAPKPQFTFGFGGNSAAGDGAAPELSGMFGGAPAGGMKSLYSAPETTEVAPAEPRKSRKVPLVVSAWAQTEAVIVRHMLCSLGGRILDGMDVHSNPWGSLVPQPVVDDHGSVNLSNAFVMAAIGV